MASGFPGSPKVLRGGLFSYQLPELLPTVIMFQYNPDEVSRSIQANFGSGGGQGDSNRLNGPPKETLTFSVEVDAADQLEQPGQNGVTVENGLHPAIAAMEQLVYPSSTVVVANEILALAGSAFIQGEQAPMTFLIWGSRRVLPVKIGSISVKEQAFDQQLNPIRASVDLSLDVLTYKDLEITNPGYWVYMASFVQKEVLSGLNLFGGPSGLQSPL